MSKTQFTFKKQKGGAFELYAPSTKETIIARADHPKYGWLESQDAGRVINVYTDGKMTSAKDYFGLYKSVPTKKAAKLKINLTKLDNLKFSDEEVSSIYAKHGEMFFQPKTYTASHILVKVDPASNAEERRLLKSHAEDLLARARDGEDFYNLAYYESEDRSKFVGGSLGTFHGGQTVAEFDEAVKSMQPGEISGLVRTMYGFHIIKLDASEEARQLTFEEAAPKKKTSRKASLVSNDSDADKKKKKRGRKEKKKKHDH